MQGVGSGFSRGSGPHPVWAFVRRAVLLAAGAALALPTGVSAPAWAQQAVSESVQGRPRPEYDPLGFRLDDALNVLSQIATGKPDGTGSSGFADALGSFFVNTRMEFVTELDDNIFREANNEVSDTILKFRPSADIRSDWANHGLILSLGADIGRYVSNGREDYEDLNASLTGRVDVDEGQFARLTAGWSRNHEPRSTRTTDTGGVPTVYRETSLTGEYTRDIGQIFSRTTLSWSALDYDDVGTTNHDDRDRWTYELRQRLGHDLDEGSQIFVEGALSQRDFRFDVDDNGRKQGSRIMEGLVGLTWDASGVTFAEIAVGYMSENFREPAYKDQSGPSFRGRVLWNVTGLVTLSGTVGRQSNASAQVGASSELETTYALGLDWEALYNLIVTTEGKLTFVETQGLNKEDETQFLALRARWLMTDYWRLTGALEHEVREASEASSEFASTRLIFTLSHEL